MADAKQAAEIKRQVDEGVAAGLRAARSAPPYPLAGQQGSPLDVLTQQKPDPSQYSVQAAADEYEALVAKKLAASV